MPTRVHLPDGIATFPDGMPIPDMESVLQKQFGGPQQSPPRSAPPWSDVVANPEFQKLSPAQQEAARQQYFDTVVAPNVPADKRAAAKQQFDEYHKSIYREPASSDQILDALRKADAAGEIDDARQLAEMYREAYAREAASSGDKSSGKNLGDVVRGDAPKQRTWGQYLSGANTAFRNNVNAGATFGLTNRLLSPEEKAADAEHPIASTAGDLVGGLMSGSTELKALSAIPGVGRFIATRAGQPIANAARVLGTGAAAGAQRAAGEGGDIGTGAAEGAAGAAVAASLAKGAVTVGRFVAGLVSKNARISSAVRIVADRLKITPAEAAAKLDQLEQDTGRQLTVAEILDIRSGAEFQKLATHKDVVGDAFRANEERVLGERPGSMQSQIGQGGRDTVSRIDAAQAQAADDLMGQIGNSTAAIPESIPVSARQAIARNAQQLASNGNPVPQQLLEKGEIDLRTLDLARRDLAKQARAKPGEGFDFSRDYVRMLGARANPRYSNMLDQFAADERQIAGVEAGQKGTNPNNLRGAESADAGTSEFAAGRAAGTRNRFSDAAATERGAVSTADTLRQAPADVTDALGPQEAGRLQRLGSAETQTAQRLKQLNTPVEAPSNKTERMAQMAAETAVAAGGHVLTGFRLHAARRVMLWVNDGFITPKVAAEVARLMTDPKTAHLAVQRLRASGVADDKIRSWIQAAAGAAGSTTAGAAQPIPGRASGGPIKAGQPYIVGERGPETIVPAQDGVVIPYSPATLNLGRASKELHLTPQEQYLYYHGIRNMIDGKTVTQPDGSVSSILQMVVDGPGGKIYNIPSVWDGKVLNEADAKKRAAAVGWDRWPSYSSYDEADRRYIQDMHPYMDRDAQQWLAQRARQ